MSQDLVVQSNQQPQVFGRAGLPASVNHGAVAIEQERAIAEAQGQLILAKKFPRDLNSAHAELMKACKSKSFAQTAFYTVPNRGSGPSIRFAEEVARVYGNFQYGHRELGRSEGRSEIEVYAWDMENNNRSTRQITVMHVLDKTGGAKKLTDQTDIDNKIANVASKQMRGRILALMPKWLVADGIEECRKTIAGNNDEPLDVRVRKMTQAFAKFGVTPEHLERYLGHKLDEVLLDELVDLTGIFNAIKDGGNKASEFFGSADDTKEADEKTDKIKNLSAENARASANSTAAKRATATDKKQTKPQQEVAPAASETQAAEPEQQDSNTATNPSNPPKDDEPAVTANAATPGQGDSKNPGEDDLF